MNPAHRSALLHLSLIRGIGPAALLKIVVGLSGMAEELFLQSSASWALVDLSMIYHLKERDFIAYGLSQQQAAACVQALRDQHDIEAEISLCERLDVQLLTLADQQYPTLLRHTHLPPIVLYVRGAGLATDRPRCAVVGSRQASNYAYQALDLLLPPIVARGCDIVSGGARGVDAYAHQLALRCSGGTVAVLGSGLNQMYPSEHKALFESVVEHGGAIISPFSMQTPPDKGNFPARNRIIAGISLGVLVAQAARKSGALITAHYALEQGRFVGAVPGSITDLLSEGCHALIAQGARLIGSSQHLFEELGWECEPMDEKPAPDCLIMPARTILRDTHTAEDLHDPVLRALDMPRQIDELCLQTGLMLDELHERLFDLQLDGKVIQNIQGFWARVALRRG